MASRATMMQVLNGQPDDYSESDLLVERLFELSPAMLCIADAYGYFKRLNPAFRKTLGHSDADLLSRPFIEFVHPGDRQRTLDELGKLATGRPAVHFENRYRHADGSYRWLLWNTVPDTDEGLLFATALDITERKAASEMLQTMGARLVLAEEEERRRIARGLHDDVGQTLLAVKLALQERDTQGERQFPAQETRDLLDRAIRTMRTLTFDLASEALYEVGLEAALQSVCERAEQQSDIRFEPPLGLAEKPIPETLRVILYRAARELTRNVVKHSQARTARLSLHLRDRVIRLTVDDDGCGFDAAKRRQNPDPGAGFGLYSIDRQLHPIGGSLEIASTPGSGTRAVIVVPLDAEGQI